MKNFKNTLAIVALLAIGSASAKSLRRPTYDPSGAISQPVAQPSKTIKSQLLQTLNRHTSSIAVSNKKFMEEFIFIFERN